MSGTKTQTLLAWLRVPPEPTPPSGSPGSLRVFRAGRNYLRLRLLIWAGAQTGLILGLMLSVLFLREMEIQIELERETKEQSAANAAPKPEEHRAEKTANDRAGIARRHPIHQKIYELTPRKWREIPRWVPKQALFWISVGEYIGLAAFAVQFVWTLIAVRLDYELRWYMVTDRSLRLRWGVLTIHESTMSFANLQQVSVRQGPLQRLLRLADVEVRSAGGGSVNPEAGEDDLMHRSIFRAVDNAPEIRDLILARLQHFRQAGLGDPDDPNHSAAPRPDPNPAPETITAARALLAELRAWRQSIGKS